MIWKAEQTSRDDVLSAHIWFEISRACSDGGCDIDLESQLELARSVAFQAERQYARSAVPSDYLLLLAARALWAVGETEAARRLVAFKSGEFSFPAPCAEAAFHPDISLQVWWSLLSVRAVRHAGPFDSTRGGVWSLDLSRTFRGERDCLELMLFRVINAVVHAIAPLWDQSSGQGALALRRVDKVASSVLKSGRRDRKTVMLASEIRRLCSAEFSALRDFRGWTNCPDILSLDW